MKCACENELSESRAVGPSSMTSSVSAARASSRWATEVADIWLFVVGFPYPISLLAFEIRVVNHQPNAAFIYQICAQKSLATSQSLCITRLLVFQRSARDYVITIGQSYRLLAVGDPNLGLEVRASRFI